MREDRGTTGPFPIRVLAERTGVGSSTLRAWERRYGLLVPERTPKGHRLYTEADVARVERILGLLHEGHSLAAIAGGLEEGAPVDLPAHEAPPLSGPWSGCLRDTLQAVRDFSTERVEAVYNEASSLYPVDMVTERLIEPVLAALGEGWRERESGIAEEHFYASWLRNRLGARFHHGVGQAAGVRLLCAGVPGSYHEIGLMLFAISALSRGYRVLYFGPDLPLDQLPAAVGRSGARGVVLSSRLPVDRAMEGSLAALAGRLEVPVMLGGPASDSPLADFEGAGGVRLGSRIAVALRLVGTRVPVYGGGRQGGRRRGGGAEDGAPGRRPKIPGVDRG